MRRLVSAALSLAAALAPQAAPAQIAAQPLPPPAGATGSVLGTPRPPLPARPAGKPVPSVAPPTAAKTPVPHKSRAPTKPVAKPAAKPAPKAPAKTPAKPAAKQAAPAEAPPPPVAPPPPPRIDPTKGTSTGLPLPRWVALRADEVNLRTGPGTQYPIDWVYHRRDYPVRVLREYEVWRLVEEQDGTKGWVHQATLTGRRGFLVTGAEQVLRAAAEDTADAVARLAPGVVGHIRKCPSGSAWCEVQAGDYRGWLKRAGMYGVAADEVVE